MNAPRSLCVRCGGDKELPLGRCPACGHLPAHDEAVLSVLVSSRVLGADELDEVQARLRRGEALRPAQARLEAASALLYGGAAPTRQLDRAELAGLLLLGTLFTPVVPLVVAWTWRGAPAARQALVVAAVTTGLCGAAWVVAFSVGSSG